MILLKIYDKDFKEKNVFPIKEMTIDGVTINHKDKTVQAYQKIDDWKSIVFKFTSLKEENLPCTDILIYHIWIKEETK